MEQVLDSIVSGVVTDEEYDSDPYGFRVTWIRWFSGFRDTGLRVGDLVVALDGVAYAREQRDAFSTKAFGAYAEYDHWANVGAVDSRRVVVTVLRGHDRIEIEGRVLAERYWLNDEGRRLIGPGGPDQMQRDGFDSSWSTWLERLEGFGSRVLDRGWRTRAIRNSRQMLEEHLSEKERVDFLTARYPGPFASQTLRDWEAVCVELVGRRYDISEADLAWRNQIVESAGDVATHAGAAREAFLAALSGEVIEPFPSIDPMRGDRASVAGKVVALPTVENDDWVVNSGHPWLVAGSAGDGWYFVDARSPAMRRAFEAMWRFQKKVSPDLRETHEIIGRIGPNPKMLIKGRAALRGLVVEPLSDTVGGKMFVDVRTDGMLFAGEAALGASGELSLDDAASPEQVVQAYVRALKLGNEEFWRGLFATWEASRHDGQASYGGERGAAASGMLSGLWVQARGLLADLVCDVRAIAVDDVLTIVGTGELPGAPLVEGTIVEVDHIGLFDGEYHTFSNVATNRLFPMQRRDGGPWRIAEPMGL